MRKLIFGTSNLGKIISRKVRLNVLQNALDLGIVTIDTSPYYAYGLSEALIGQLSKKNDLQVNSKFGIYPPNGPVSNYSNLVFEKSKSKILKSQPISRKTFNLNLAKRSVEQSLKTMNIECISTLFVHDPVLTQMDIPDIINFAHQLKNEGKIKQIGLSGNYDEIARINAEFPDYFDKNQVNYSGVDWKTKKTFSISSIFAIFEGAESREERLQEVSLVIKESEIDVVVFSRKVEHLKMLQEIL